jgi:hypothetical protein
MKTSLLIAVTAMPLITLAADPLPKRPHFDHYLALLAHSPFALATIVPTATQDLPEDLYLTSAICSEDGAVVTLASATDRNFKEVVSSKAPNEHGFVIQFSDIQCGQQK